MSLLQLIAINLFIIKEFNFKLNFSITYHTLRKYMRICNQSLNVLPKFFLSR